MPIDKIKEWFIIKYESVQQLLHWIPIIWKDRDWDSHYLYIIMKFKITKIRILIEKCDVHCSHADEIRQMKVCEQLLDRIIKNDYMLIDYADKNQCACPDPNYTFEPSQRHKNCRIFVSQKCDYCSKMFKYWVEKQDLKEKADKHYLFKMLEKHSCHWWC